jgi:hypothetical protein
LPSLSLHLHLTCLSLQYHPQVEAQAEKEVRMDEGPLTLETLNRTEEGGEAFLGLLKELLAEREGGGGGALACLG